MSRKIHFANKESWNWAHPSPFAQTIEIGEQIFLSGQQTLDANGRVLAVGNIAAQTRNVFENMTSALAQVGASLSDLARLNTYYVFDGDDAEATRYWEDMTEVRLEYFTDPGPAATAVRIKGMPYEGQLIQIEGIALAGTSRQHRQRIMPDGSWDWSIPVPLSQGWRVGERIFVGGQISADKQAQPVAPNDIAAQTGNVFEFIRQVVLDAGGNVQDISHVKICYKHGGYGPEAQKFFEDILNVTEEFFHEPGPALTAFGVDLLYPGLVIEIDAMAIVDTKRRRLMSSDLGGRYQPSMLSDGWCAAGEIHVSGQTALGSDGSVLAANNIEEQARIVFDRVRRVLAEDNADLNDLVKLNLFFANDAASPQGEDYHAVAQVWSEMAPDAHPAMTPVRVYGLPRQGLLLQADGIAIK
ncbi:MAG: Rid family hydrolase [Gammaproteobacteria bacterium]|nr:Rid family hydrolase [Gammaproteobacteria bacterium]